MDKTYTITPATKYLKVVIPAKAGIQEGIGCRIKACPGLDPGSGMTELACLIAGLIYMGLKKRQG